MSASQISAIDAAHIWHPYARIGAAAPGDGAHNRVALELDDLFMNGAADGDGLVLTPDFYDNPCPDERSTGTCCSGSIRAPPNPGRRAR